MSRSYTLNGRNERYGRRRRWFESIAEYDQAVRDSTATLSGRHSSQPTPWWDSTDDALYIGREQDCDGISYHARKLVTMIERNGRVLAVIDREAMPRRIRPALP